MLPIMLSLLAWSGDPESVADAFREVSGASLVFEVADLPSGAWFDVIRPLDAERRAASARVALAEIRKYPPGYLGSAGLRALGVFDAVGSRTNDGFHSWDASLEAYVYYGMYNGRDSAIAAHYSDRQLPLTIHHEVYHHIDAANGASRDDARFAAAIAGESPYPAPAIPASDLAALRAIRVYSSPVLPDAVSEYAKKAPGEDQAETARHLFANLPDALLQVVERPELPGSQRFLHVIHELESVGGLDVPWLVSVALGRSDASTAMVQRRLRPDGSWVVHGVEDDDGVNWTLRRDVRHAAALQTAASPRDLVRNIAFLADYHAMIASAWSITPGTRAVFVEACGDLVDALPPSHRMLKHALKHASLEDIAAALDDRETPREGLTDWVLGRLAERGAPLNRHLTKVDALLPAARRGPIREAQVATVRIHSGGSGVAIAADGLILTAGHVIDRSAVHRVTFPDGTTYAADRVALDERWDLGLLRLRGEVDVPWAAIAPMTPAEGDAVVAIGQPGRFTPGGEPTHYRPFHASKGVIRGGLANPLGNQRLGRTMHDAWTYWGHSGSPLFDVNGRIVALHNSWDPETAMRHAVTWEAIRAFVDREG